MTYGHLSSYPGAILSDPITGEQADAAWSWSVEHIGIKYGWIDIIAIALVCLHVPTPRWAIRRLSGTRESLICSQAVVAAYDAAGIHLGDKPAALTTPGDLLHVLRNEPEPAQW